MSTVRTYRHTPNVASDPAGTLVDTEEVDLSGGTGAAHADTTGWSAGGVQITATRQDSGEAESDKSSGVALTVNAAGFSDTFTGGTAGDPLTRNPYGSSYASPETSYPVGNGQIDGAGHAQATGDFNAFGAVAVVSSSDTAQVVVKGTGSPVNSWPILFVRNNGAIGTPGTQGYCAYLYGLSTGNFTTFRLTELTPDGGNVGGAGSDGAFTGSRTVDHTIRLVASGTSPVTLSLYIDNMSTPVTTVQATNPYTGGHPGFGGYGNASGGQAANLLDDFTDTP